MTETASKVKETKDKVLKQESKEPTANTEQKLNVYQKLVEVRKTISTFTKDAQAGEGRYEYVSGSQVLRSIKEEMDNQGLLLQPLLKQETLKTTAGTKKTKYGESRVFTFEGLMGYIWINAEDPKDKYYIPWYLIGEQDDPSKAFGSALTYAERYFLLKFFGIPTDDDDPDAKKPQTPKAPQKPANPGYNTRKPADASIIGRPATPPAKPNAGANGKKATDGQIKYIKDLVKTKLGQDADEYFEEKGINLETLDFSRGRAYIEKLKGMPDKAKEEPKEETNEQEKQETETGTAEE